jgi:hypothetical protein
VQKYAISSKQPNKNGNNLQNTLSVLGRKGKNIAQMLAFQEQTFYLCQHQANEYHEKDDYSMPDAVLLHEHVGSSRQLCHPALCRWQCGLRTDAGVERT